jgi:NADH-dependent peroxiredoxin subunit F
MADIEMYTMQWCPYCAKSKALLKAKGLAYREIDVTTDEDLQREMVERTGRYNVPQIFLDGELVGSYDDLAHLNATGELDRRLGRRPVELKSIYDVAIIGGGPAGLSAAMYAGRKSLTTILISGDIGGQVGTTHDISNYPGFELVTGPDLVQKMFAQAAKYGIDELIGEHVTDVALSSRYKILELESGRQIRATTLVIASGVQKRHLQIAGEAEFEGRGVVYCSTCDGPLFKGKDVAVVGAGNSALQAAMEMNGIARKVYLVTRGAVGADAVLQDNVATAKRVEHLKRHEAVEIHGSDAVESLTVRDKGSGRLRRVAVEGVFVEVGLYPNTSFALDLVETNERGEIKVDGRGRTGVRGVFAAGDCTDVPDKQIVVSVGDGAKAALAAFEYLVTQR